MLTQLVQGLHDMGVELQRSQLDSFEAYRDELMRWNQRVNLTAITDPAEIETRHFLDSLTLLYALQGWRQTGSGLRMIDIGSGAGFPGIPDKLVLPDMRLTLLEATGKKVEFLSHMVALLGLRDIDVVHGRAEEVAHSPNHREAYDIAAARAVASLSTLAEVCLPFVSVGGLFVALKKGGIKAEVEDSRAAITRVGGEEARLLEVPLPQLSDGRYLVCSTKAYPSPLQYPRRTGIPFKRPL
jgi:16S rRNA (guanine527-N7)-methyltransferase